MFGQYVIKVQLKYVGITRTHLFAGKYVAVSAMGQCSTQYFDTYCSYGSGGSGHMI